MLMTWLCCVRHPQVVIGTWGGTGVYRHVLVWKGTCALFFQDKSALFWSLLSVLSAILSFRARRPTFIRCPFYVTIALGFCVLEHVRFDSSLGPEIGEVIS